MLDLRQKKSNHVNILKSKTWARPGATAQGQTIQDSKGERWGRGEEMDFFLQNVSMSKPNYRTTEGFPGWLCHQT